MWIKNQTKDCLLNANDVSFFTETNDGIKTYQFRCYGYGVDYYILGDYSSEKKAFKVLNKIQEEIEAGTLLFEMPRDDEV